MKTKNLLLLAVLVWLAVVVYDLLIGECDSAFQIFSWTINGFLIGFFWKHNNG